MLNVDLIDHLYSKLPKERQQQLVLQLFKKSRQSMAYFRRTKDISLSKLEILADFFQMPLDYFRLGSTTFTHTNNVDVDVRDNILSFGSTDAGLLIKNQSLQTQLESKEEQLKEKDKQLLEKSEQLKEKDERMKSVDNVVSFMNDAMNGMKSAMATKDAYIKSLEDTIASLKKDKAS